MLKKFDQGVDIFQLLHEEDEYEYAKEEDTSSVDEEKDESTSSSRAPDYTTPISSTENIPVWVDGNSKLEIAAARSLVLLSSASHGY